MTEMTSLLISIDRPFIEYMSNNEVDILTMLRELEDAEVTNFEINRDLKPKILAVASHMFKRLPNNEALKVVGVKTGDVLKRKSFLDQMYTTKIDNKVSMQINDVGHTLEIPDAMISKAMRNTKRTCHPIENRRTGSREQLGCTLSYQEDRHQNKEVGLHVSTRHL